MDWGRSYPHHSRLGPPVPTALANSASSPNQRAVPQTTPPARGHRTCQRPAAVHRGALGFATKSGSWLPSADPNANSGHSAILTGAARGGKAGCRLPPRPHQGPVRDFATEDAAATLHLSNRVQVVPIEFSERNGRN
jgi:hypothetical protein